MSVITRRQRSCDRTPRKAELKSGDINERSRTVQSQTDDRLRRLFKSGVSYDCSRSCYNRIGDHHDRLCCGGLPTMSDKSHVTLEAKLCVVCGCQYQTGTILLDTKLRERFDHQTLNGFGLCDQHLAAAVQGMVAIIEVDESKSDKAEGHEGAWRTGTVVLVPRDQLKSMTTQEIPDNVPAMYASQKSFAVMFPPEVIADAKFEAERSTVDPAHIAPGSTRLQ